MMRSTRERAITTTSANDMRFSRFLAISTSSLWSPTRKAHFRSPRACITFTFWSIARTSFSDLTLYASSSRVTSERPSCRDLVFGLIGSEPPKPPKPPGVFGVFGVLGDLGDLGDVGSSPMAPRPAPGRGLAFDRTLWDGNRMHSGNARRRLSEKMRA